MKKTILATVLVSSFASSAMAYEMGKYEREGWRIEGGYVSQEAVDINEDWDGFVVSLGYDVSDVAGYSIRASRGEKDYGFADATVKVSSLGAYADFGKALEINSDYVIKPYGLIGLELDELELDSNIVSGSQREMALAFGIGTRVTVSNHISVTFEIKRSLVDSEYSVDFDTLTIMSGYKF